LDGSGSGVEPATTLAPVRQVEIHQVPESGPVGGLTEVHDLVNHHVFQKVGSMVQQGDIEPDPTSRRHTTPPARRHAPQTEELVPDTDTSAPLRQQQLRHLAEFAPLPAIERTPHGVAIRWIGHLDREAAVSLNADTRSTVGSEDLEAQLLVEPSPHLARLADQLSGGRA
jgi:hypothetical protein